MALARLPRAPEYPKVDPGMQVRVRGGDDPWSDAVGTLAGWLKGVSTVNSRLKLTKKAGALTTSSRVFVMSTFNMALRRSDFTRAEEPAEEVKARHTIPRHCEGNEHWIFGEEDEELRFSWDGLLVNMDELAWVFGLEDFEPVPTTHHDVNDELTPKLFREIATSDILSTFNTSPFSSVIPIKRSSESDEFTWKPSVKLPMLLSDEDLESLESGQL